jgi:hypothetical protein
MDDDKEEDLDSKEEEDIDDKDEVVGDKEEDLNNNEKGSKDAINNMLPKLKLAAATPTKMTIKNSPEWKNLPPLSPRS